MNKYYLNIRHTKILAIPVFNAFIYIIETLLLRVGIISDVWISRAQNIFKDGLIKTINNKQKRIICKSYKLQSVLQEIESNIVLDLETKSLKHLSREDLYQIMWSLVFAKAVTARTKMAVKELIPDDYKVLKTVVIPYNDSLEVYCDYIFQTAKVLANRDYDVYIIVMSNARSIFKMFSKNVIGDASRKLFFKKNGINIIYPITLFPIRLCKLKIIFDINRFIISQYSKSVIKHLNTDYLWCFDPSDLAIAKAVKGQTKIIYDCVDYFSSLDKEINQKIKIDETGLIRLADYFFVNSNALMKAKSKIRKPNAIVAQGFDLDALSATQNSSLKDEKAELENIKQIFSKIPKPVVGFIGTLGYRLDFKLLFKLIKDMPNVSFVLTDTFLEFPDDDRFVGARALIDKIKSFKNVYFVPKTHYRSVIKRILEHFDIGMIPYDVSYDFNLYCYPMKLFEYFYMGLPVVSTPIKELKRFPGLVTIGKNSNEWKSHIKSLLSKKWPNEYKTNQRASSIQNSWNKKVGDIISNL